MKLKLSPLSFKLPEFSFKKSLKIFSRSTNRNSFHGPVLALALLTGAKSAQCFLLQNHFRGLSWEIVCLGVFQVCF